MFVVLDNIRSALNVGSILRTCDAFGVTKVYFGGITPGSNNIKVKKTALGAEKSVSSESVSDLETLLLDFKKRGMHIYALEITPEATDISEFKPAEPYILLVGNEVSGISERLLALADKILKIEMKGAKESLNVSVAFGIALYALTNN